MSQFISAYGISVTKDDYMLKRAGLGPFEVRPWGGVGHHRTIYFASYAEAIEGARKLELEVKQWALNWNFPYRGIKVDPAIEPKTRGGFF